MTGSPPEAAASQWYTLDAVTTPSFEGDTHRQKETGCAIWNDLTLALVSRSNTCSESPAAPATDALSAMTLDEGFISAESAVIGLRVGVIGDAMSTMTTEFCGSFFFGFERCVLINEGGEEKRAGEGELWKGAGEGEVEKERSEAGSLFCVLSSSSASFSPKETPTTHLRPGLADADELVRLHGGVGEGDELRVDADGRELFLFC